MPDYFEQLKEFAMKADDVNLKPVAPEDIGVEDSTYALDEIRKRVESTGRLSPAQVDELMDAFLGIDAWEIPSAWPKREMVRSYPSATDAMRKTAERVSPMVRPGIDAFESLMDSLGFSATEIPEGTRVIERSVEKIPSGDALLSASMPKRY